jgi:hypothetical protein
MNKLTQTIKVFLKRISDNPSCLPSYLKLAFYFLIGTDRLLPFYEKIKILTSQETIDHIIKERQSFVRFGTGEAQIALGMGFYAGRSAQTADKELVKRMNALFDQDKVLIGIGARFLRATDQELKKIGKYNMFFRNRVYLRSKLKEGRIYGEAFAFRENFDFEKLLSFLKTQKIFIVSRQNTNIDKFISSCGGELIEGQATNAFSEYPKLLTEVKKIVEQKKPDNKNTVFLLALGPSAKPLTVDIDALGYTAWDVGAFFEDFVFEKYEKYL